MSEFGIDRDALNRMFGAESEESLLAMERALIELEHSPEDEEALSTVFRAAHTMKGNAATLGFSGIVDLAHHAENLLDHLRSHRMAATHDLVTLLLRCVDELEEMVPRAIGNPDETVFADVELLAALRQAAATGTWTAGSASEETHRRTGSTGRSSGTLRVATAKLDAMLETAGEIATVRGRLDAIVERDGGSADLIDLQEQLDRLSDGLQELVLEARMVPIAPVFQQQSRTVRDFAARQGKQVRLVVDGADAEVDTAIVEKLRDPITHMVRNAIDHGIETPDERVVSGKDPTGTIALRAFPRDGLVIVEVRDDGAGIDKKKVKARARWQGIDVESMTDGELLRLVLQPGFSTASEVTDISGRGVGLDVVERNIAALRGTVTVESQLGKGTTFTLRLPLTLTILRGLSVEVAGGSYIVPLATVTGCADMPETARASEPTGVINVRGEPVPYVRLGHHFGIRDEAVANEKLVFVESEQRRAALVVDELLGEARVVVKPLGRLFRSAIGVSGSALFGNGTIGLVLEVAPIVELLRRSSC